MRRLADGSVLVGAARSRVEIDAWLLDEARCPSCGDTRTVPIPLDIAPPGEPLAARASVTCLGCGALGRFAFERGPGWGDEPPPGDPRIALDEAPSAIVPEATWSRWLDEARVELDRSEGVDLTAHPEEVVWVQDAAMRGLGALNELQKLRRTLTDAERYLGRRLVRAFEAVWGPLPEPLAWLDEGVKRS